METNKKIEVEFIPYEQALELESLGYILGSFIKCYGRTDKKLYWTEFEVDIESPSAYHKFIPAYTYRQALKWLRDEHKLMGFILPMTDDEKFNDKKMTEFITGEYFWAIRSLKGILDDSLDCPEGELYGSHEEAELACIKKIIEVIKNKPKAKPSRNKK